MISNQWYDFDSVHVILQFVFKTLYSPIVGRFDIFSFYKDLLYSRSLCALDKNCKFFCLNQKILSFPVQVTF